MKHEESQARLLQRALTRRDAERAPSDERARAMLERIRGGTLAFGERAAWIRSLAGVNLPEVHSILEESLIHLDPRVRRAALDVIGASQGFDLAAVADVVQRSDEDDALRIDALRILDEQDAALLLGAALRAALEARSPARDVACAEILARRGWHPAQFVAAIPQAVTAGATKGVGAFIKDAARATIGNAQAIYEGFLRAADSLRALRQLREAQGTLGHDTRPTGDATDRPESATEVIDAELIGHPDWARAVGATSAVVDGIGKVRLEVLKSQIADGTYIADIRLQGRVWDGAYVTARLSGLADLPPILMSPHRLSDAVNWCEQQGAYVLRLPLLVLEADDEEPLRGVHEVPASRYLNFLVTDRPPSQILGTDAT